MKISAQTLVTSIRKAYDKLIALVVLLVLLGALIVLALNARSFKTRQTEFDRELRALRPAHEHAVPQDRRMFEVASQTLREPMQLGEWTNRLMVPELRVRCVNCDRPIPYGAMVCAYCKATQPTMETESKDKDRDGMPDEWETKYGLNPLDPDDAFGDPDRDGFTNKEEFDFGTNPRDPKSHPPLLAKVSVAEIKTVAFPLVFKSASRLGKVTVAFNVLDSRLRPPPTVSWRVGETLDPSEMRKLNHAMKQVAGFKLVSYDPRSDSNAVVVLRRDDREVRLIRDQPVPDKEFEIVLHYALDGRDIPVRVGGSFEVGDSSYTVKDVDIKGMRVLVHDPVQKTDVWLSQSLSNARVVTSPEK
jgi:hypothetical protein